MSLTKVSNSMITGSEFNLLDYGADPTGVADSTAAIQAWMDALYANNASGFAPQGTYLTSGNTINYTASKKFSIRGTAKGGTSFKKFGASTNPVFKFTISSGDYLELNLNLQDFEVDGNNITGVNGLDFNAAALVTISRVRAKACSVGLEGRGFLVSSLYDTDFSGNKIGARFSRGTDGSQPYANAINLNGCRFNGNTDWGIYYGQGSGLYVRGCDIESNGTAGDTNTGGMFVAATVDDETGFAAIQVIDTWFESNKGHTFLMDAATNALLKMDTVQVYAQESTRAITVGTIRSAVFVNVLAPSANATLTCSAETQFFAGNVFVHTTNLAGAALVAGAYKTSIENGTTWTATTGAIGTFETTVSFKTPFVKLTDGISAPATEAGRATLFVDSSDGDLKIKFGDGTVKTIVTDT
jgi:hypothetical protein